VSLQEGRGRASRRGSNGAWSTSGRAAGAHPAQGTRSPSRFGGLAGARSEVGENRVRRTKGQKKLPSPRNRDRISRFGQAVARVGGSGAQHVTTQELPAQSLTQRPTSPNHQLPLTAFETHNGRSTFAAGAALHTPRAVIQGNAGAGGADCRWLFSVLTNEHPRSDRDRGQRGR
jgi:hypothetical protein